MTEKKRIAVIGAGIAGLSCAYELFKQNLSVKVFEKEAFVGGRMLSRPKAGIVFDTGAQILGKNYTMVHQHCQELGLLDYLEAYPSNKNYVFRNGELHLLCKLFSSTLISKSNLFRLCLSCIRFHWLSKGMNLFTLESDLVTNKEENAYDYAVKIAHKEIVEYLIDPLFYGNNFYGIQQIDARTLLSMIKFTLQDVKEYCQIKGKGINFLPEKLAERLDVERLTLIESVKGSNDNMSEVFVKGQKELFDIVVLALPAPYAATIYSNPTHAQKDLLTNVSYSATITVSFLAPVDAIQNIAMGFVPLAESEIVASFVGQAIKGKEAIHQGKGLINFFLRESYARKLMPYTDSAIFDLVKLECIRVCPVLKKYANDLDNHDLMRWPYAMPLIPRGFISKIHQFWEKGQGENHVYLCGDYLASPYVEGSIRSGQRVAQKILKNLSLN